MSNRALLVGDVHATPEELDDCSRLIEYVQAVAETTGVKTVVFMGDQTNTHEVLRVEVLAFWRRVFSQLREAGLKVYVLVGNHDYAGEGLQIHSMMAHEDQVSVVDGPKELFPGVVMLPYVSEKAKFLDLCARHRSAKTLICHQTFEGSKYENGFYAPDGVEPSAVPQDHVISGHIHTPQKFDKVTYIGAPRWRSLSDADVERSVCLYEFDRAGAVKNATEYSTGAVCKQIKYRLDTPEAPISHDLEAGVDWRIDIRGPVDWIEKRKAELAGPGVRIRTFNTTRVRSAVKESDGIGTAFRKFLSRYTAKRGSSGEALLALAQERLGV